MNTFSSIDLDYRLVSDNAFAVSLNGLHLCTTHTPVSDSARILRQAGVADETLITLSREGPDNFGIIYFIPAAISGLVGELSIEQITNAA